MLAVLTAAVSLPASSPAAPPSGLVAAYSFDEGRGTVVRDASGNANTGTTRRAAWSADGRHRGALSLDGRAGWVTIPHSPRLDLGGSLTVEAWVYPAALGKAWRAVVFEEDASGATSGQAYALYASTKTGAPLALAFGSQEARAFGRRPLPLRRWSHLAETYDGATLRLYVNGEPARSTPLTGATPTTSGPLRIGGNSRFGEYFRGRIDDVRIYARALTGAQIRRDMATPVPRTVAPRTAAPKPKPKPKPVAPTTTAPLPTRPASVFLAPGGSDGGPCSAAAPCRSLQRGLSVAASGAVVQLAPGTYPGQSLTGGKDATVTFRPAAGGRVTMGGRLTLAGARNVRLVDFDFPRSDPQYELLLDACNSAITLTDSTGRRFVILEGNGPLTFEGGSWGGYSNPGDEDSAIGTAGATGPTRSCGGKPAPPTHDVLFDGITFHDNFWGKPESQWGGSHPDCFEINGYVDRVTIRNSTFLRCQDSFLAIYSDQGNVANVTVENNTFTDLGNTTYYGSQWVSGGKPYKCGGIVFKGNTWRPNNPNGKYPYSGLRTECEPPPGVAPALVIGNDFQKGPQPGDCARFKSAPFRTVWKNNTFRLGSPCSS
ncbi:MAG: hypothetical protein QOI27_1714 [Gaiellaceae bacterium]|nr:hypothetical protein [Gaiellaceae bacterium]